MRPAWCADCCLLRDTRNTSRAESTGTVDREWISGETPLSYTPAGPSPSLLDTSPHLGRRQLLLCYPRHPETPHTTLRRPVPRGPRLLLLCPSAELLRPPEPVASYRPNTLSLSLPCLLLATQFAVQPAASAHIANLSVPSATCRGCVLLCAHIPRSPCLHWPITRRAWRWLVRSV